MQCSKISLVFLYAQEFCASLGGHVFAPGNSGEFIFLKEIGKRFCKSQCCKSYIKYKKISCLLYNNSFLPQL